MSLFQNYGRNVYSVDIFESVWKINIRLSTKILKFIRASLTCLNKKTGMYKMRIICNFPPISYNFPK